jgi:hypothetical protein
LRLGKTSLGKSIARATGRDFVRVSLCGVGDKAEIRGDLRAYIGSMPGKIIQSMRKAKSSNPLFLLDGVDKMGADFGGDPSSALLEVLDPEQNHSFSDHYLEVGYDLSDVMFITTANTLNIPPLLIDCMEIVRIAGYTEDEKVEIARKHLIPHVIAKHGLKDGEWTISDGALLLLIRRYTREAGVRNLERELSSLIRKAVKELALHNKQSITVEANAVADYLGAPKFCSRRSLEDGDLCSRVADRRSPLRSLSIARCAGRADKAQDRSSQLVDALLDREMLDDALLDLLQPVVAVVEDLLRERQILVDFGVLVPGNREQPVEIVAHDGRLGRHRRHLAQLLELVPSLLARLLRELGARDLVLDLGEVVLSTGHYQKPLCCAPRPSTRRESTALDAEPPRFRPKG